MSTPAAIPSELLEAIRAAPDDDAPRLVWADLLCERGDPRGEFVQVQCALAREGEDDPDRREALLDRERALLKAHQAEWLPPGFLRHGDALAYVRFHRGLLSAAALPSADLLAAGRQALAEAPGLSSLTVLDAPTDWEAYRAAALPPSHVGESVAALHREGLLPALGRLALQVWDLDVQELGEVVGPRALRLGALALRAALWGRLGPDAAGLLAAAPNLEGLRELEVLGQPLGDEGAQALASAAWRLERLELVRCELTGPGVEAILAAYPLSRTTVDLRGANLDLAAVRRLAQQVEHVVEGEGLWVVTSAGQVLRVERVAGTGRQGAQIEFPARMTGHLRFNQEEGAWWVSAGGGVRLGGRLRITHQPVRHGDEYHLAPDAIVRCILRGAEDA